VGYVDQQTLAHMCKLCSVAASCAGLVHWPLNS
jgi:hypothetical protein